MVANGLIPDGLLVYADGTQRLRRSTAARWVAIRSEVQRRYGWAPAIISGGGYRSLQQQVAVFTARYVPSATGSGPFGDVRWWNGVRYIRTSSAGAAAVPGTSNHGLGTAVDVVGLLSFTSTQRAQFAAVAAPAGFSDAEGRAVAEPWHWVDTGPQVDTVSAVLSALPTAGIPGAPTGALPTDLTPTQEDDMPTPLIYRRSDGAAMIVTPDGPQGLSLEQWQVWENLLGDKVCPPGMHDMDPGPFAAITASLTRDDTARIVSAVVAAMPQAAGGLTADQVTAAVKAGLAGLTLKATQG